MLKRLALLALLLLAAVGALVSDAPAGDIADGPCFDVAGPDTATCPAGTEGVPYSIRFKLKEGSGCSPGDDSWTVSSGNFPPGLTLGSNGDVSGTPTQAGNFTFYVTVSFPVYPGCNGGFSDKRVTIPINPGPIEAGPINPVVPKLTIGPEQDGVPNATVGASFSLPMTANLSDAKTWSLVDGALPPGLALGPSDGVISGTPTTAGSYAFTVSAVIDAQRADTKALAIVVRNPLTITGAAVTPSEVGVSVLIPLAATGGSDTYTWSLPGGALPPGVAQAADGTISGRPSTAGTYDFTASVADTEGRTASSSGILTVAPRLAISTLRLRPAKLGRLYRQRVATTGGVLPTLKIKRGPLPRGIRFDPALGVLSGTPLKAGTWRVDFEARDSLGVKSTRTLLIRVLR